MAAEIGSAKRLRVIIFDSDGSNPYSEELLHIFRSYGVDAGFVGPVDHLFADDSCVLRPRFSVTQPRNILSELRTLFRVVSSASSNQPLIVVWARPYQKIILGMMACAKKGSVFYIVHNPVRSRWPVGIRRRIESFFIAVTRPVVHSESLRQMLLGLGYSDAGVIVHPPYQSWRDRIGASHTRRELLGPRINLLVLGRMEPDKFKDLPALISNLDKLPVPSTLRLLVRPRLTALPPTSQLVIDDSSQDGWIADGELAESLRWADILVAPYEAVTESGTVQLALTLGLRVVAFSGGALDGSLTSNALASSGDYEGLVEAIVNVSRTSTSTAKWTPESRARECYDAWIDELTKKPGLREHSAVGD